MRYPSHCVSFMNPDVNFATTASASHTDTPAVLLAHTHAHALEKRLRQQPGVLLVVCYCAEWCKTCTGYRRDFEALAQRLPQHLFAWIDIEESPQLLDDADVENFPTLLLQREGQTLFFGTQQPFIHHLEGLLQRSDRLGPVQGRRSLLELL